MTHPSTGVLNDSELRLLVLEDAGRDGSSSGSKSGRTLSGESGVVAWNNKRNSMWVCRGHFHLS